MLRWKGKYTDKETLTWDLYDGSDLVAWAIQRTDGKWKVRVKHQFVHQLEPYLILDADPKVFMPHLLMTLHGAQRDR